MYAFSAEEKIKDVYGESFKSSLRRKIRFLNRILPDSKDIPPSPICRKTSVSNTYNATLKIRQPLLLPVPPYNSPPPSADSNLMYLTIKYN